VIISHKYKFIFIKTSKTAGTSIEIFLSQHCGENDIVTPIYPDVEPHRARNYKGLFNPINELIANRGRYVRGTVTDILTRRKFYNHISALNIKSRISQEIWNNYYKFCVERNPWDKTLSHYHMCRSRSGDRLTLDGYFSKGYFCQNLPLYSDQHGHIIVDKVIKYEKLNEELSKVFELLGIPFNNTLGVFAKSEYRGKRDHPKEIFSNQQRIILEEVFKEEIKLHQYDLQNT